MTDTISMKDFDKAVTALRKANVPPPYKAIYSDISSQGKEQ